MDTYKAYKIREHKFTSWLQDTGEKLGLKIQRPKAKTKTKTTDAKNGSISINQIPQVVETIVSRGLSIPDNLRNVLRDVISQRKEATAFYKLKGQKEADQGHAHYITILEWALKKFEAPRKEFSSSESPQSTRPTSSSSFQSKTDVDFNNFFELLNIENPDLAEIVSSSGGEFDDENVNENQPKKGRKARFGKRKGKSRKGQGKAESKKKEAVTNVDFLDSVLQSITFDPEDNNKHDLYFMIYCFFRDQNSLREYLQERWCDYNDGTLSLTAVAVITNTAFEIIQRAEKELLAQIPRSSGLRDYKSMADLPLPRYWPRPCGL